MNAEVGIKGGVGVDVEGSRRGSSHDQSLGLTRLALVQGALLAVLDAHTMHIVAGLAGWVGWVVPGLCLGGGEEGVGKITGQLHETRRMSHTLWVSQNMGLPSHFIVPRIHQTTLNGGLHPSLEGRGSLCWFLYPVVSAEMVEVAERKKTKHRG
jgi:hypothetical protein